MQRRVRPTSSRSLQNTKFCKIVKHCKFANYKVAVEQTKKIQIQKARDRRRSVLSNAKNISSFMINHSFSQHIQESDAIENRKLAKWSEFSLIMKDKILMLSFMTLDMDLVIMTDKKGMLQWLAMLPFISLNMDLIKTSDKMGGLCLVF